MKLITKKNIYVQMKDLKYLTIRYNKKEYLDEYIYQTQKNKTDNNFIKITNIEMIKDIIKCEEILDMKEYEGISIVTLFRIIKSAEISNLISSDFKTEKRIEELKEVIRFKNKELDYSIPLLPYEIIYEDSNYKIESTIFENCYIIKPLKKY